MTTTSKVLYASQARPWLKYYDPNYIDQPMPECSAFDFVRQQNKNRLSETALEYYGRKFTYAALAIVIQRGVVQMVFVPLADIFECRDGGNGLLNVLLVVIFEPRPSLRCVNGILRHHQFLIPLCL